MPKKVEKTTLKSCSEKLKSTAQMAQTEEFMFQNVAYWPTVYRTGLTSIGTQNPWSAFYATSALAKVVLKDNFFSLFNSQEFIWESVSRS